MFPHIHFSPVREFLADFVDSHTAKTGFFEVLSSQLLKSENSVLIDLTTKSTTKLMVEPPANFPVTDCDKYIVRKLAFMDIHCMFTSSRDIGTLFLYCRFEKRAKLNAQ